MIRKPSARSTLNELWDSTSPADEVFHPTLLNTEHLPEPARRYLLHAIASGTPLASAVRLRMHGEFRMKRWYPFTAEQVIRRDGEMLWRARIFIHGLPIIGYDSLLGGKGEMEWKLLGLLPVVRSSGPETSRSAIGRVMGEAIWLPSLLCEKTVTLTSSDTQHIHARFSLRGEETDLSLNIAENGGLAGLSYQRWGNPDGGGFHYSPFGGIVEDEGTFRGYTIPTRLRIGWHYGTSRFESDGEFFRVTIDEADFR